MCGPPDFAALEACVTRLVSLSATGLAGYTACQAVSWYRRSRPKRDDPRDTAPWDIPGSQPALEGSRGQSSS